MNERIRKEGAKMDNAKLTWKDRVWYIMPWINIPISMHNGDASNKVLAWLMVYNLTLAAILLLVFA